VLLFRSVFVFSHNKLLLTEQASWVSFSNLIVLSITFRVLVLVCITGSVAYLNGVSILLKSFLVK